MRKLKDYETDKQNSSLSGNIPILRVVQVYSVCLAGLHNCYGLVWLPPSLSFWNILSGYSYPSPISPVYNGYKGWKELFNSQIHCLKGAAPKGLHLRNFTYKASFTPGLHADYYVLDFVPHAVIAWDLRVLEGGEFILHVGEMYIHGADFNNNTLSSLHKWIKPPSIQILIFSPSSWLWG